MKMGNVNGVKSLIDLYLLKKGRGARDVYQYISNFADTY